LDRADREFQRNRYETRTRSGSRSLIALFHPARAALSNRAILGSYSLRVICSGSPLVGSLTLSLSLSLSLPLFLFRCNATCLSPSPPLIIRIELECPPRFAVEHTRAVIQPPPPSVSCNDYRPRATPLSVPHCAACVRECVRLHLHARPPLSVIRTAKRARRPPAWLRDLYGHRHSAPPRLSREGRARARARCWPHRAAPDRRECNRIGNNRENPGEDRSAGVGSMIEIELFLHRWQQSAQRRARRFRSNKDLEINPTKELRKNFTYH